LSSAPSSAPIEASLWEQLVKTAFLGSERSPNLGNKHQDELLAGLVAQVKAENREAALLSSAALVAVYERSGTVAESASESSLSACAADGAPRCGPGAAAYLRRILDGQFLFLLPEFVAAVQAAGKRVPEELLPNLLEAVKSSPTLAPVRHTLATVMGHRGQWLVALNPEWSFIGVPITPEEWEVSTRADRVALLRQLRQANPEQAIALLEPTWKGDAPEDRVAFVSELEHGLSMKDEPFLENALDDRRKEVRQKAAELLMSLPESRLVERMWQRVAPLFHLRKPSGLRLKTFVGKPSLEVDLPDDCDDALQRDGVEPQPPQGTGKKAWWLQQMVRAIPPGRWESHLQLSPEKCVTAFQHTEFSKVLLTALLDAVRRHNDARWARPLVEIAIEGSKKSGYVPVAGTPWFGLLETVAVLVEADRDAIVSKQLDRQGKMAELAFAMKLLHSCPGPWSVTLAQSMLNLLRYMTGQMAEGKHPALWAGLGDLAALGRRMPLSMAEEAQLGWPEDAIGKPFFKPVQTIIDILQFRSKMHKEINR